jgi:hypothetical protein
MKKPFLSDYIYIQRGVMSKDFCRSIIENNRNIDETWQSHQWSYFDHEQNTIKNVTKENELLVKFEVEEIDKLKDFTIQSANAYIDEMSKIDIGIQYRGISNPRINRYITGSDMKQHHDCIISLFEKGMGAPVLSVVGVLNDDYEGGDFIMFDNTKIDLNAGDILIFPSNFAYTHRVNTVTQGERWSFVSWMV